MIKEAQIGFPGCAEKPNLHVDSKVNASHPNVDVQFLQRSPSAWLPPISPFCQQKATGAWCLKCLAASPWMLGNALISLLLLHSRGLRCMALSSGTACGVRRWESPALLLTCTQVPASAQRGCWSHFLPCLSQLLPRCSPAPCRPLSREQHHPAPAALGTELEGALQSTAAPGFFPATGTAWERHLQQSCCFSAEEIANGHSLAKPSGRWVCCLWAEDGNLQHPHPKGTNNFHIVSLWGRNERDVSCISTEIPHQERKMYFMWYYSLQLP